MEYEIENYKEARELCEVYFKESKGESMWRLAFRIKRKMGSYAEAYSVIEKAVGLFPTSISVWKDIIELEVSEKHVSKARALIDRAIQKMPRCEEIYIMAVEL